MKKPYKYLILLALLLGALVCYGYGINAGAVGLIIAGVMFEMVFWFGLFSANKSKAKN